MLEFWVSRILEIVLPRRTLLIAMIALLAQSAMAQPRTPTKGDFLIGKGMEKPYAGLSIETLQAKVARYLCCNDERQQDCAPPDTTKPGPKKYTMTCPTPKPPEPPPLWPPIRFVASILETFERAHIETAIRWAHVDYDDGKAPPPARLTIGVTLARDGKKLSSAQNHFFKPTEWAERLWDSLRRELANGSNP